jgi:D-lactate dehydrogenase
MKDNVMLINTSRGALINTADAIEALKNGKLGYLGIDVYEQEEKLFLKIFLKKIIQDDDIQRLMSFPNVLTAHQAFTTGTYTNCKGYFRNTFALLNETNQDLKRYHELSISFFWE